MELISIVLPTHERPIELSKILLSIEKNKYPAKEIIVIDTGLRDKGLTRKLIDKFKPKFKTNILYLDTCQEGYDLAMARNMGVAESMGSILMFLDDRYELDEDVLGKIAEDVNENTWHYGKKRIKGKIIHERPFIENFSWLYKKEFRKFGCFNERINMYGGMSQDVRERWQAIGNKFKQEDIYVTEIASSKSNHDKEGIWKMKYLLYRLNN